MEAPQRELLKWTPDHAWKNTTKVVYLEEIRVCVFFGGGDKAEVSSESGAARKDARTFLFRGLEIDSSLFLLDRTARIQ